MKQQVDEKADEAGRKGATLSGNEECIAKNNSSMDSECKDETNSSMEIECKKGDDASENTENVKGADSSGNTECEFKRGGWCMKHLMYGEKVV